MKEISKKAKRKRIKVSFFGNFGKGNLGNESTLEAILWNLRRHLPDAEVSCICTGPEAVATTYKIAAVQMRGILFKPGLLRSHPVARFLRKLLIGIPSEAYRWVEAFRALKGTDMLVVPGTQFLSDNLTAPFGWPYLALKWSITAKIRGCKLLYVSVGVGPLRRALSRFFVKSALLLADYRSYRDDLSRQYLRGIGFDTTNDPVYPDLAFSLPLPAILQGSHDNAGKPIVAVGVKDYQGQYGLQPQRSRADADNIYREFIDKTAAFVAWLLEHKYTVRVVIGDASYDPQVRADLGRLLNERKVKSADLQVIDEPIESLEKLVSELATSDIVVSPRFHNVILSMLLNKPVIALAYHQKFSALMEGVGLAKYNLHIDHLEAEMLIERFIELERKSAELKERICRKMEEYRTVLDEQYRVIFSDLRREQSYMRGDL
jgi:polysaccharide pyruvyl transferase WcaK-like protein